MKKTLALAAASIMAIALAACGGSGTQSTTAAETAATEAGAAGSEAAAPGESGFSGSFLMGTGSATGNYYQFGNAMCTVINRVTGANITVNATGGSTENARLLGSGDNEFAMIQSDVYSLSLIHI